MNTEIEKLYRLANIEPFIHHQPIKDYNFGSDNGYQYSEVKYYPPFTAEKQLEIIKWLMKYPMLDEISLFFNEPSKTFNLRVYSLPEIGDFRSTYTETQNNFEDMLCGLINNLWQDLTEEEKQQVKGILE